VKHANILGKEKLL